ncbi:MAG: hypothetical protein SFV22_09755 [Saprospiraceae bacterium]|nr:hypothetical protein [Saprospiraceae bacterium]
MCLRCLLCFSCIALAACGKEAVSLVSFRELSSPTREELTCIAFSDSLHGALTGGRAWESGFVFHTSDGGNTWVQDTALNRKMEHVCFDPDGQGYACGQDLLLYRPPGEQVWQTFRVDFKKWNRACHFPGEKRGMIAGGEGYHGGFVRSFGPETFWQTDTLHDFPNEIESVWYSDFQTVHAAGFGWVMRSDDAGHSWQRLDITGDFFQCVQFADAHTGYICGNSGTLLKTTDGGRNWKKIRQGGSVGQKRKGFRSLWFVDPGRGWVVGENGIFWETRDGGATWQTVADVPPDADFTHVFVLGKKGWVTVRDGRLFEFEWE